MTTLLRILTLITLGPAAALAGAADSGPYLGAGFGQGTLDLDTDAVTDPLRRAGFTVLGTSEEDGDTLWRLYGGYRINPYLDLEATWLDLGSYAIETGLGGANPGRIDSTLDLGSSFNLGLVVRYPFAERFSVFGKIGALFWSADAKSRASLRSGSASASEDDSGTDLSLGLGVGYAVTDALAVRLDWDHYQIGGEADTDLDSLSIGVQYHF